MAQNKDKRVIVCGSGLAGLTTALTAIEAGAQVTLFEKAPEVGGTTAISGGLIWTGADYDVIRNEIPNGDGLLQWLVYDTVEAGREWLMTKGVKLGPLEPMLGHGRGRLMDPPGTVALLAEQFKRLGGDLQCDTALESLLTKDGRIVGVQVLSDGRLRDEYARAVVLATGGFQGNPELVARYIINDPDNLYLRSNPWSTGDAFIAAKRIGAGISPGLDTFYGHALIAPPGKFSRLEFRDVSQYYGQHAVAVNMMGQRFCDESEGKGEEILNQRLAREPGGRGFYIIDRTVLETAPIQGLEVVTRTIVDRARGYKAPMVTADTLEDLAKGLAELGVPAPLLLNELTTFNKAMSEGRANELSHPRRRNQKPLSQPPFMAVGVKAAITFTMGGLLTDERTRVLRRSGTTSSYAGMPTSRAFVEDFRVVSIGSIIARPRSRACTPRAATPAISVISAIWAVSPPRSARAVSRGARRRRWRCSS